MSMDLVRLIAEHEEKQPFKKIRAWLFAKNKASDPKSLYNQGIYSNLINQYIEDPYVIWFKVHSFRGIGFPGMSRIPSYASL